MVTKFEDGKVYVEKGSKKPFSKIIEAAIYESQNDEGKLEKNLMIDTFYFDDRFVPETNGRIYATQGSIESPLNYDPKDYEELGKTEDLFEIGRSCLFEKKPKYSDLENDIKHIQAQYNKVVEQDKQLQQELKEITSNYDQVLFERNRLSEGLNTTQMLLEGKNLQCDAYKEQGDVYLKVLKDIEKYINSRYNEYDCTWDEKDMIKDIKKIISGVGEYNVL